MPPLTQMVMQENTEDLYWFGPRMPYVQWESWGLYCLAPESACSRGIQAGCERGLSPRSWLWEVSEGRLNVLSPFLYVCGVECATLVPCVFVDVQRVPCLPFYSHKGWQGFYMCKPINYL